MSVDFYVEHSVRSIYPRGSGCDIMRGYVILLYYQGTIDQFINSLLNLKNQSVVLTGSEIFPVQLRLFLCYFELESVTFTFYLNI